MAEYDIQGPTRVCAATGRELKPGDRFHGVLFEEAGKLVRRDYCDEGWAGPPEGHLAHWVSRIPTDDKPRDRKSVCRESDWSSDVCSSDLRIQWPSTTSRDRRGFVPPPGAN